LATSRPTAVNLFWALDRLKALANDLRGGDLPTALEGVGGVLTHCNAGGLATAEYGTALSVFFTAQDQGHDLHVYVDETRPLLQGARLTAWELMQRNIKATLICDSMAAQVMREQKVQAVVTGADRIAANGDSANKIGELRDSQEITHGFGRQTAPEGVDVYNPAFDVTPAKYIAGIITERGVISPVTRENVLAMIGK